MKFLKGVIRQQAVSVIRVQLIHLNQSPYIGCQWEMRTDNGYITHSALFVAL